jgi:VWFA-related protein
MLGNRNLARIIVAMAFLALCAVPSILTQEKPADSNIKVQSVNVVVDLIVTDRHGRHVQGLTANDFKVFEDGVPQKIIGFTPSAGSATELSSPAVATLDANVKPASQSAPAASPAQPRLLTVVLDLADNKLSNTKTSSDAVLRYLDKTLGTGDYVAIYYIDSSLHMALPFTNDLQKARETLQRIETRKSVGTFSGSDRAAAQEEINDLYQQAHPETGLGAVAGDLQGGSGSGGPGGGSGPMNNMAMMIDRQIDTMRTFLNMQNTFQAQAIFRALRAICMAYRDMPGRKNVVLFSEGFLNSDDAKPEMEAVAEAANRANVSIYVIDPEGVETNPYGGGSMITEKTASRSVASQMTTAGAPGAPKVGHGSETKFDAIRTVGNLGRGDQLQWLADTTGGLMVKHTNDLAPAFSKVLDDGRDYYTIAYLPAKTEFDGKFHSLKVEVEQRGYQLRYRKGYWAMPRGQAVSMTPTAAQLMAGFQNGLLKATMSPDVFADLLLAPDGHYSAPVSVSFPANKVPLEREGQEYKGAITLVLVARDAHQNLLSVCQRAWNGRLNDKEKQDFEKTTVTLRCQLPIADPQSVSVEAILQLSGTAFARGGTNIEVPDPASAGFRLTSILVSDRAEQATCLEPSDPLCFMNVRLRQPAKSRFPSSSKVVVYFAANDLSLDPQTKKPRVGVAFTLKSGNEIVKTALAENIQSLSGPSPNAVLVLAEYDLKSLHAGNYTLQALVRDLVRNTSLSQQSQFVVE